MTTLRPSAAAFLALTLSLLLLVACGGHESSDQAGDTTQAETTGQPEAAAAPSGDVYRAGAALGSPEVASLSAVLADPEQYDGKTVRIEATIDQVCQKKGCWMILRDGDATTRVTFKDYGFFVPLDTKPGSVARIDAEIHRETLSEEMAKHYEEETEGGDPAAIEGPQEVVSVVATGVEIAPGES